MAENRSQTDKERMGISVELRAINIKNKVNIFQALHFIGVRLLHGETTQQIICPFHDDTKPSARAYGDSNKLFCFTCHKMWDVINVVQQGKNVSFFEAVELLEKHFKIDSPLNNLPLTIKYNLEKQTSQVASLAKLQEYAEEILIGARFELGLERYCKLLYALDLSRFYFESKRNTADEYRTFLRQLIAKIPTGV